MWFYACLGGSRSCGSSCNASAAAMQIAGFSNVSALAHLGAPRPDWRLWSARDGAARPAGVVEHGLSRLTMRSVNETTCAVRHKVHREAVDLSGRDLVSLDYTREEAAVSVC